MTLLSSRNSSRATQKISSFPFKVGLVDWGIGGLSVYKELMARSPVSCVYLSDSGFTPYGKLTKQKLISRLNRISHFFRKKKIYHVIIACNAASTALEELQSLNPDMEFYGMLSAGAKAIQSHRKKSVLVLGGRRTIRSGFFQMHFASLPLHIETLVAQPLSAIIEKGEHRDAIFVRALDKITKSLTISPELVLLACTHYPAAYEIFVQHFPQSKIIDPATYLIDDLRKRWRRAKRPNASSLAKSRKLSTKRISSQFYTTGNPRASRDAALKAFRIEIKKFHPLSLILSPN